MRGIIDTGADVTYVDASVIEQLQPPELPATAKVQTTTSGLVKCRGYVVAIGLVLDSGKPLFPFDAIAVYVVPNPAKECDVLIGRDILSRGVLTYDGPAGTFTLSFPHEGT